MKACINENLCTHKCTRTYVHIHTHVPILWHLIVGRYNKDGASIFTKNKLGEEFVGRWGGSLFNGRYGDSSISELLQVVVNTTSKSLC